VQPNNDVVYFWYACGGFAFLALSMILLRGKAPQEA